MAPSRYAKHNGASRYVKMVKQSDVVCRFWLRNSCVKGDNCDFSHSRRDAATAARTTECYFYKTPGGCTNRKCTFLHPEDGKTTVTEPQTPQAPTPQVQAPIPPLNDRPAERVAVRDPSIEPCPDYSRGFCLAGRKCGLRHVRRDICLDHLAGSCPRGRACAKVHFGEPAEERNDPLPVESGSGEVPSSSSSSMENSGSPGNGPVTGSGETSK